MKFSPEYRNSVSQAECENMTYSQEFIENSFDSDGENNLGEVSKDYISFNSSIASVNTKQNSQTTNAMIINKLREILPYFTSKDEKSALYNMIDTAGNNAYCQKLKILSKKRSFYETVPEHVTEYESLHLPLDTSKHSKRIFYYRVKHKR